MRHKLHSAAVAAALVLAQAGGAPYNPGPPQTPGTRTPEQSPATVVAPPASATSGTVAPSSTNPAANIGTAPASPGLSFGAAPPPIVSPGK